MFDKIQYLFQIKTSQQSERNLFNMIKDTHGNPTAVILLSGERLDTFPLSSERRKRRCSFLPRIFNIVLEVLAKAIKQEKEIKDLHFGKKGVELSLFAGDIVIDAEKPVESTHTHTKTISTNGHSSLICTIQKLKNKANSISGEWVNKI